jgi:hypothetical protein
MTVALDGQHALLTRGFDSERYAFLNNKQFLDLEGLKLRKHLNVYVKGSLVMSDGLIESDARTLIHRNLTTKSWVCLFTMNPSSSHLL